MFCRAWRLSLLPWSWSRRICTCLLWTSIAWSVNGHSRLVSACVRIPSRLSIHSSLQVPALEKILSRIFQTWPNRKRRKFNFAVWTQNRTFTYSLHSKAALYSLTTSIMARFYIIVKLRMHSTWNRRWQMCHGSVPNQAIGSCAHAGRGRSPSLHSLNKQRAATTSCAKCCLATTSET